MNQLIVRKLIVDDRNELFDAQGMRYAAFASDFSRVREYAAQILADCPEAFREGTLLEQQLSWMLDNGGLEFAAGRCDRSAAAVYDWADAHKFASPFVKESADRSPVTATIDFDERVDAAQLAAILRHNGIVDVEPYRKLGRNQIRVALFPAIEPDDVTRLTRAIDFVLEHMAG